MGSGLSGRMDDTDQRVSVLLQRITDLEAENDYLFEERDAEGEVLRRLFHNEQFSVKR